MPALDSLPAPPTLAGSSRWSRLPPSAGVQMELITRAAAKHAANNTVVVSAAQNQSATLTTRLLPLPPPRVELAKLGELLGQEQLAGSSQWLCHYRNNSAPAGGQHQATTIPVVCQLGCCPHLASGCCQLGDSDPSSPSAISPVSVASYHWVLALLCAFILCVFVSTLALLALYWANRRQETRRRRFMLAEKYSLGIGSRQSSSYGGASSMASSSSAMMAPSGLQHPPTFYGLSSSPEGHFCQFYAANSPAPSSPSSGGNRHQSASASDARLLMHHVRPFLPHVSAQHQHAHRHQGQGQSPPASSSSSSAYHAPDEVFFRSAF